MDNETLSQLHAPLTPILRHILALAPLPRAGVALDLACGPGLKAALLAEALGPRVRLVGVDIDREAIREGERRMKTREPGNHRAREPESQRTIEPRSREAGDSILSSGHGVILPALQPFAGVVGDALALPLRDGCCDAAFCIAALGLFADRLAALRELRRALRSGGLALLAVGTQAWAQVVRWPDDLSAHLALAYDQALADGAAPIPAAPDLGGELAGLLVAAGFAQPLVRAFWLDWGSGIGDRGSDSNAQQSYGRSAERLAERPAPAYGRSTERPAPCVAATEGPPGPSPIPGELPLLPWPALRVLLAGRLSPGELSRCDELAAAPDIELCVLALVALAHAP